MSHNEHKRKHCHRQQRQYVLDERTIKADSILTHPVWGLAIFIFIIWFIFFCTFRLGAIPQEGIEWLMDKAAAFVHNNMQTGWINDFISKGVIMGVGSVLAFLPNILILFFFLSLLSETEYLPRAAPKTH
jgi:ferrous iron transport protein B